MRKDIYERVKYLKDKDIKPNYTQLAVQFDCDYRTVKKYFENDFEERNERQNKSSKLDEYKEMIIEKLHIPCTYMAIYKFIVKKGYSGKYTILRDFCHNHRLEQLQKATIRFETNPGLQAQVDWKESMKLMTKTGELLEINIFLIILGYSRLKYIELTLDRKQTTVFQCLVNAFKYFDGVPKEI